MSFFDRGNGVRIYYELKSPADSRDRIVLLSGFAATCGMWDPHLDFLASQGISTLCLDNRGCGQTVSPTTERPLTALDMAMDVVLLLEHVGWGMERVHVWGASMGGFLALSILVRNNRLISLCLQVTCAGLYPFAVPLGEVGWKRIFGVVGMANKTPEEVVSLMMEKGFSKEILEDSERKAKIHQSMVANFARMYSWNMETLSKQSSVNGMFQFSPARVVALGQSRVPIVVIVQTDDQAMPTARQLELAKNLGVEPVVFVGGHMEAFEREPERLREAVSKCLDAGRAHASSLPPPIPFTALEQRAMQTFWVADSARSSCSLCNAEFGLLLRRHHCRLCGEIFCADCSSGKRELPFHTAQERVCKTCLESE